MPVPLRKENEIFSYADYLTWKDDERWELIDGIAYNMTPAPAPIHQEIVSNLLTAMNGILKAGGKKCKVYPAPFDVRLAGDSIPDEANLDVVQPDISIICDETRMDDRGYKGPPALVVEVLSPSTMKKDLKIKLQLYEKYRVPEYWIIHPEQKMVMQYRLDSQNRYGRAEIYFMEDTIPLNLHEYRDNRDNRDNHPPFQIKLADVFSF